jgi:hypothetical protein
MPLAHLRLQRAFGSATNRRRAVIMELDLLLIAIDVCLATYHLEG